MKEFDIYRSPRLCIYGLVARSDYSGHADLLRQAIDGSTGI
jgi:hypothetical protein